MDFIKVELMYDMNFSYSLYTVYSLFSVKNDFPTGGPEKDKKLHVTQVIEFWVEITW